MNKHIVADKQAGALYGLAIGDALGAPVEFKKRGEFSPITVYRSGGPFSLGAGDWTDDTSMALALADSLGKKDWNLEDQMERYLDWWQNGKYSVNGRCFDIGHTTINALLRFRDTRTLDLVETYGNNASNGSLMRLAPVPIKYCHLYPDNIMLLVKRARDSSLITHSNLVCRDACAYLAFLVAALINQYQPVMSKHHVIREFYLGLKWPLEHLWPLEARVQTVANGSYRHKRADEIVGDGGAVNCLEAALWAFSTSSSFEEAVLKAVNLGDDTDTTGAVCGQLAGAYWGLSGIPLQLVEGLAQKEMIQNALNGII